jgi:hypothetical protein
MFDKVTAAKAEVTAGKFSNHAEVKASLGK